MKLKTQIGIKLKNAGRRFCWYRFRTRVVIADTPLLDQDGRGGYSEQPIMDIPKAEKDM